MLKPNYPVIRGKQLILYKGQEYIDLCSVISLNLCVAIDNIIGTFRSVIGQETRLHSYPAACIIASPMRPDCLNACGHLTVVGLKEFLLLLIGPFFTDNIPLY